MKNFNTFTFFNQLTAMPKRLAMVLTILLIVGIGRAWGAEETLSCSKGTISNNTMTFSTTNFTFVHAKGSGSSFAAYTPWRVYANNTVTITAGSGVASIDKIEIVHNSTYYSTIKSSSGNVTMANTSGGTTTINSTSGKTVTLTVTGTSQSRWSSIKITYTAASSCDKKVTVNKGTPSNGSFSISKTGTYETCAAPLVITLSNITPSAGYQFGEITQSGINTDVTIDQANKKVTYAQNTSGTSTINVTFNALPTHTVTWKVNGEAYTEGSPTTSVAEGSKVTTLPSTPTLECSGKTFVGWSNQEVTDGNKPSVLFTDAATSPTINASTTFYAVFAEGGGLSDEQEVLLNYTGGTKSDLTNVEGISASGLGSDYAVSNAPYRVKLDDTGDYILYTNNSKPYISQVYFKVKMLGGNTTSKMTIKTSDDGTNYTSKGECSISGDQNNVKDFLVTINTEAKYLQLYFTKGSNVGFGPLIIYTKSSSYQNYTTECVTAQTYTVTIANDIQNGSVTANPTTASEGDEITLIPTPANGFKFSDWNVTRDDNSQTVSVINNKFTMPASDVTVSATFVAIPKLAAPINLHVTNISCTGATLTWDNVANNNGYLLSVKNTSSGTSFNSNIAKDVTSGSPTLNPGTTYSWKVVAKGDATNYLDSEEADGGNFTTNYKITYDVKGGSWAACADGCVAGGEDFTICSTTPTKNGYNFMGWSTADDQTTEYQSEETIENVSANITLYAVWEQKKYTITWMANGQEYSKQQDAAYGTALSVPSAPDAATYACDDKVFVGWTETQISGSTDNEPADLFTTKTAKVEEAASTYYAVFATADGGGTENVEATLSFADKAQRTSYSTSKQVWEQNGITLTNDKASSTSDVGDYANPARFYKSSNITIEAPGNITNLVFTCSSEAYATSLGKSIGNTAVVSSQTVTLSLDGTNSSYVVTLSDGQVRLNSLTVTYTTSSGTSYSEYTTTCVKLPDPVISFVTTPADPIVFDPVNCGSTTTQAQAKTVQVSGANLQEYVSVEVTGPYKIARTSSTNLSDYSTSLTLDKTNTGTIHSDYQTVYIISCPPAQSTDATTGTLTFTTKKGNTLTVNLSTPTVNCTTYALTFNDRGNKTVENYYAGVEVPQPADPTGVCTEPIHYVFDGWAEATVTNGSTEYTKVTFPYTMPGQNKTLYAVYRYLTSGGNGDYNLVTSALDDWSGDYLIAYDNETFADGRIGGKDDSGIGDLDVKVDLSAYISDNTIPATEGDKYNVTLEAVSGGYLLKTKDGKYNYQSSNVSGLSATDNQNTASEYKLYVDFVSSEEVNLCLSGNAEGAVFRYNTTGYFRFYKNGGQEPVHLYKKASGTTLYTSAPVCGPLVEITSDKDIYVTGGKGVHSTVVAQKKITFSATRLQPNAGGNAPSIKVPAADITIGGTPTTKLALSITQDLTEQGDGTYAGTGEITISYTPTAFNVNEDINVQLRAEYNTGSDVILDAFTVHARSLPQEFVIVAKQGEKWYALNGDMSNGSSANPANGQITLNDDANPTQATYAPCNTIYTFDGLPNTGDRTRVRFQGIDGAWLWAASGTNVGIQNKSLKETPAGDAKAYNWKLETEDNITYQLANDNNSRLLGLSGEKFGMYASGVQEFRILPYVEKCLYNYAPTNLKVSVLKGSYVTLTWDAVAGATKYQYSTDATTWTDGTAEPTVTINGLSNGTNYTYYIRAYHADAGVSQECFDYSEITFTTADCDDVPTDITYTANLNSITVSWTASAATATVKLYSDETGTTTIQTLTDVTSPRKFTGLTKNTTYYVQVFSGGTCASQVIKVSTEDVEVEIVEWFEQGIIVDINTDETVGVTLENEVSYGSGTGAEATELFFSKYYEATGNVKLVALYNGTKNIIDLTNYEIHYGNDSWENTYITLKDFGSTKGQIQPGEELILYTTGNTENDTKIMNCVHNQYPDGKWVEVTSSNNTGKGTLSFAGKKTLVLKKAGTIIDVIGALDSSGKPTTANAKTTPSWGDDPGWTCATGLSIADDTEIGISTNRCLLIRNNTVTSGENAVTSNIDDFVTLCSEWKGAQVPDAAADNGVAASCENFAYVGTFDYSDYYTQYESMGDEKEFDENARNADGTVTIPITDLYKQSCRNIRIKLSNEDGEVLTDREYKVPIMITTTQGTDGQAFIDLRHNLATKIDDGNGGLIDQDLTYEEVLEICKTCDVVVRDNATLTKIADDAANDHPQVRNVYVYENSSLIVPNGTNYTINNLSLRRNQDAVASVSTHPDALKLPESAAAPISLDFRLSAENWHWFTLPYDCNINEVTWADGTPAQYNTDWYLMTYDGEKRAATQAGGCWKAYTGTTINAGEGFIIAINGNINNPAHTYELRFPMSKDVLVAEGTDKTVDVRAWGVETDIRPNHKGWNLVGNPYLAYYQRNNITNFEGLRLGQLTGPDPQTGYWEQTGDVPYVVVPVGAGWIAYEQVLASETDLLPFTAYFVQVGNDGEHKSSDELSISFDHTKLQLSATPMPASIIQRATSETEVTEPVIVGVSLTNSLGESDKTSLVIDNQFTDEYEMNADFFKWFGDYYKYYTKPVVYSLGADNGKRAFNALSEDLATQPISLGMYAAQAGNYTFTLDRRSDLSKVQEVWLYDATQDKYTNLMQDSYTFNTAKTESAGRFFLSVKMAPKVSTDINNVTDGTIWATTQDHTIFVNGLLSNAQLWIYDATGKLLHTDQTQYYQHTYQVPVSGTYFVRVQNTMQTQTIKVVVE